MSDKSQTSVRQVSDTQKMMKMKNLILHYKDTKKILTESTAMIFNDAVDKGINPFSDKELLREIIYGMMRQGFGPLYLSNEFLDRPLFEELWKQEEEKNEDKSMS